MPRARSIEFVTGHGAALGVRVAVAARMRLESCSKFRVCKPRNLQPSVDNSRLNENASAKSLQLRNQHAITKRMRNSIKLTPSNDFTLPATAAATKQDHFFVAAAAAALGGGTAAAVGGGVCCCCRA